MGENSKLDGRYSRQTVLPQIGLEGQARLQAATAVIIGVGALGSTIAEILARAGVGTLRLADRDYLEVHNLQRQSLYTEADVETGLPKAAAAARHLQAINSTIKVEAHAVDVTPENVLDLLDGATIALDGTDNLQTRYLLNDACLKLGIPWVYAGVVGVSGMVMGIVPRQTACLQCLFPHAPAPGASETCDVAGVLGPAAYTIASIAAAEAIKAIVGEGFAPGLLAADLWRGTWDRIELERNPHCPACGIGELNYLEGEDWGRESARLCGRDAVQVRLPGSTPDFDTLAERWRSSSLGEVLANPYVVRLRTGKHELTLFSDNRVIVKGTDNAGVARELVARYIGV